MQNPLYQLAKENLLPGEKVPVRADEGWVFMSGPHPPFSTVPLLPKGDDCFGWWILRLRHSAPRRMTRWCITEKRESFRIRETKLKDIYYFKIFHWFFEHWFCLALCSLFFIDVIWISLLFFAEGKLEKDELIVNDYYLKECESVKTRI